MNRRRTEVASILANTAQWIVVADNLESAASNFAKAMRQRQALSIYYYVQELVRDPANADLIEPLEQVRIAYERACGEPIPPRKK